MSIPLVGKNAEAKFFAMLEKFRFADGSAFDFRVDKEHFNNSRTGKLANSNERGEKGFVPTNELGKTYGPVGHYKVDWIFIRPAGLTRPNGMTEISRFAHFGRTLKELNHSIPERISDHNPITVDLPLDDLLPSPQGTLKNDVLVTSKKSILLNFFS